MTGEPQRSVEAIAKQREVQAQEARFSYLLAALLALLVLYPFHNDTPIAKLFFSALNTAILVSGAFAASHSRRTLVIALGLAASVLVFEWLYTATHDPFLGDLLYFGVAVFYTFIIYKVLGNVLQPGPVTLNKIAGAIAAYILLGVAWASLYGLADSLIPGSFTIDGHRSDAAHPPTWKDLVFFSFTTLTTTGYGDTVPVTPHAQSLAILEQLTGTFYVAVLIARLAGLYQPGVSKPFMGTWRRWRRQQRDDGAQ